MSAILSCDSVPARAERVPRSLGPAATAAGPHEVLNGRILLRLPGMARALVDVSEATVEAEPGVHPDTVSWLFRRHVPAARRLAAGRFSLWAAAVVVDGCGVALIGSEASGKSTIAASLALRGCPVLSDQILDIDLEGETALAGGTGEGLELWPESARALGLAHDAGRPVRAGLAKSAYSFDGVAAAPLGTIALLDSAPEAGIELECLTGVHAIEAVLKATYMPGIVEAAGLRGSHFMWLMGLCAAAKVVRIRTNRFVLEVDAITDAILAEARL